MHNETLDWHCQDTDFVFSSFDSVLAGFASALIALMGVLFNLSTIGAMLNHHPVRKHVTTPFIVSLAFSDFLFSAVILPLMSIRFFAE